MLENKCIAIIPARGGSKRIPKKNIKLFHGKPLIAYSIEVAFKSNLFDKVVVSTDDEEIAKIAKQYGAEVPFLRPKELSDDFTSSGAVVDHMVEYLQQQNIPLDYVCTIYATAPMLQIKYLKEGFEKLKNSDAKRCFSITSMPFPIQRTFKINNDGRCEMFTPENFMARSQDLEEAYQDAGQFYWENLNIKSDEIPFGKDSIPIILPRHLVQDIDTIEDWERAELMYEALHQDIFDKEIGSSISKYKSNIKKIKSPKILTQNEVKSYIESLDTTYIQSCYLFGSYSKNTANLFSDIDILLIFKDIDYKQINETLEIYKNYFRKIGYVCNPIYTYSKYLEKDTSILIRQYIKNGILLFGDDLKSILPFESDKELNEKEYKDYWKSSYLRKLETIKVIFNNPKEGYNILQWQYIYQVLYWYAKAELTLVNKQNSLNEYTLNYIYQVLLKKDLNSTYIDFLAMVDSYREKFYNAEYIEEDVVDPKEFLQYILNLIEKKSTNA